VTTAQRLNFDDLQPSSSGTARQIGLRNDLRHAPVHVEHSRSIQPDNKDHHSDKKTARKNSGCWPINAPSDGRASLRPSYRVPDCLSN
jgi:hypothetical protein